MRNVFFSMYKKVSIFCAILFFGVSVASAQTSDLPQTGQASYIQAKYAGALTSSSEPYNPNDMTASHKTLPFGTKLQITNLANQKVVIVRVNDRPNPMSPRVIDVSDAAARALDIVKTGVADVKVELAQNVATTPNTASATNTSVEAAPNGGTGNTVGTRILNQAITIFRDRATTATPSTPATTATTKTTTPTTTTTTPTPSVPTRTTTTATTGGFTLQLGFFGSKMNADTAARNSGTEAWTEPAQSNGVSGYKVYYGRYTTRSEAEAAKAKFPNAFIKAL